MKIKKALLALALAVPAIAAAGEADHWYVTPEIGGISPDYRRSLEDQNWLFGLALGREMNRYFNLELNTEGARLHERNAPGHLYTYHTTLDALAILNRDGVVAPYLRFGLGVLRNTPSNGPNQTHFGTDAGIGTYLNLWRSSDETTAFSLRPEIKILWDEPGRERHLSDYIATLGLQFSFGGQPAASAAPPAPPAPAPQPPPPPPVTQAAPPQTAQPATPPPAPPIKIPSRGSVTLRGVTFAFNSANLTDESGPVLDEVVTGLKQHPHLRVEIQGYTDGTGSRAYNVRLSRRRAQAVSDYLTTHGVDPAQLTAHGYGPEHPVASNRTADGRSQNRRVVLEVLSNPNSVEVKGQGSTG
jgi:outer membrane protein OmpA-like peptidoglycan-associated protein